MTLNMILLFIDNHYFISNNRSYVYKHNLLKHCT